MHHYAAVIQKLQNELGLAISSFPDIGLSKLHLSTKTGVIQKEQEEKQQLVDYSCEDECFEGDFNNADRFTS